MYSQVKNSMGKELLKSIWSRTGQARTTGLDPVVLPGLLEITNEAAYGVPCNVEAAVKTSL